MLVFFYIFLIFSLPQKHGIRGAVGPKLKYFLGALLPPPHTSIDSQKVSYLESHICKNSRRTKCLELSLNW